MIAYNGFLSGLTKVHYDGHNLSMVYLGNHKVFPTSTPPPTPYHFKAQYTMNDSTTGEVACNSSSILSYTDFPSTTNLLHITVGECVDSFDTHIVSTNYSSLRTIDLTHSSMTSLPSSFMNGVSTLSGATLNPNTTTIGSSAFDGCTSLSAITIPTSVASINSNAFRNCGLREITYYSGITYGTYVYFNCYSASALTIEQGTTRIEQGTFAICSGLTNVDIPNSVTYIGTQAFSNCFGLSSITVNASTPPILGSDVFSNTNDCPILVPCEAIEDYRTEWAEYASRLQCIPTPSFKYKLTLSDSTTVSAECDGTSAITYSNISGYFSTIVSAEIGDCCTSIANSCFNSMPLLSAITLSDSVATIGNNCFGNCYNLTNIIIPNGVTLIDQSAFYGCSGLTYVEIGSGCTQINNSSFRDCTSLTAMTVNATTPPTIGSGVFNNTNNCPIYVPCESVEAYKTAWADYSSRITCTPTPSYQWVSYTSGDTVPTATTVFGVRIYANYDYNYNVTFSGSNGDYIRLYPDGFSDWVAVDENGTSIDISSYRIRPGYAEYEIPFSSLGFGGMNIISPSATFEDDIDLYISN